MRKFGIVSYNKYANFTNYGSALQSWALQTVVNKIAKGRWVAVSTDYCPDCLAKFNILNPIENMLDHDEAIRTQCRMTLPAIKINYEKFNYFYEFILKMTKPMNSQNFCTVMESEGIDAFICGSDTIFCIDEFGFDDGYYANYPCMQGNSISYAASFGDSHFTEDTLKTLDCRLKNFKSIAIRESNMVPYVQRKVNVPVQKVIDPTLLLDTSEYDRITSDYREKEKYLLLYSRRKNDLMQAYAENLASQYGWKIVEISLQAEHAAKHKMFYEAGVDEFLSLVKNAEYVVTNSYHGMIFSVQYRRNFSVFSRQQCDTKITELLDMLGLLSRLFVTGEELSAPIDYDDVHTRIRKARRESLAFLESSLCTLL
jgi:hypothetical protein